MKLQIILFLFFFSISTLLFSQIEKKASIINEGSGIVGLISIGDSKFRTYKTLGIPKRKLKRFESIYIEDRGIVHIREWKTLTRGCHFAYYLKLGVDAYFENGNVVEIIFKKKGFVTFKGVGIGDSADLVIEKYKTSKILSTQADIISIREEGVDFYIQCNIVKEIRIYKPISSRN